MSVDKNMSARFAFHKKLVLIGSPGLILAFSVWYFSLFDAGTSPAKKARGDAPIRLEFHISQQQQVPGFEIEDLRFYVHKLELLGANGQVFPIQLKTTSTDKNIALINLSRESEIVIQGWVPRAAQYADVHLLRFRLGVPFASNHANPLVAQAPLNESGMFWVWQQGYKFFKLDFHATSGQGVSYHMGSAGCESASALRPPTLSCNYPNRAIIVLAVSDAQKLSIVVDPWLVLSAMQDQKVQLCSAAANFSNECSKALKLFGIDPLTGLCEKSCAYQKLFYTNSRVSADV